MRARAGVLVLHMCCRFCACCAALTLDVGDLQDRQQKLKGIVDVVGTVGALRTTDPRPQLEPEYAISKQKHGVSRDIFLQLGKTEVSKTIALSLVLKVVFMLFN